jgi:hypothetical protein
MLFLLWPVVSSDRVISNDYWVIKVFEVVEEFSILSQGLFQATHQISDNAVLRVLLVP